MIICSRIRGAGLLVESLRRLPPATRSTVQESVAGEIAHIFSPIAADSVDTKSRPLYAWESNPVWRREDLPAATTFPANNRADASGLACFRSAWQCAPLFSGDTGAGDIHLSHIAPTGQRPSAMGWSSSAKLVFCRLMDARLKCGFESHPSHNVRLGSSTGRAIHVASILETAERASYSSLRRKKSHTESGERHPNGWCPSRAGLASEAKLYSVWSLASRASKHVLVIGLDPQAKATTWVRDL